jgi:hypothetical protein
MEISVLKKAVMNFATLEVETDEGIKEYKLVLDMNAIAAVNEELGKDFAEASNWSHMTGVDVAKVCVHALKRFHPELTMDEVGSWFTPEHAVQLHNLLFGLAFPGYMERLKKAVEEKEKGELQPNPQEAKA